MPAFAASMFTDHVTAVLAAYATGVRGGVAAAYPTGAVTSRQILAYVEPQLTSGYRREPAGSATSHLAREPSPESLVRYRVYCGYDPSAGLARPLRADDHLLWSGVTLHLVAPPLLYQQVWLIECERVD